MPHAGPYTSMLNWVVQAGNQTCALALLEGKGVLVGDKCAIEWTSLHAAASGGNIEVLRFVLSETGAIINSVDIDGCTAFELAACNGQGQLVTSLCP